MEARKWEELPMNCLVNVFGRVGVGSLLVHIPFVCKPWYKATLSHHCWKELFFPNICRWSLNLFVYGFKSQFRLQGEMCETKFVKGLIDRSAGCATVVDLPVSLTEEALSYVVDKCPALKKLGVYSKESSTMLALSVVIGKFKNLESLVIKTNIQFKDIVAEIGANCENFFSLSLVASEMAYIGEKEANTIVRCLPKLKCLVLRKVFIRRRDLIKILKGCVELVYLEVHKSRGYYEVDKKLLKHASHIPTIDLSSECEYISDSDEPDYCYDSDDCWYYD